jgi:hypothetical protein
MANASSKLKLSPMIDKRKNDLTVASSRKIVRNVVRKKRSASLHQMSKIVTEKAAGLTSVSPTELFTKLKPFALFRMLWPSSRPL